jgi:hypothetical protein
MCDNGNSVVEFANRNHILLVCVCADDQAISGHLACLHVQLVSAAVNYFLPIQTHSFLPHSRKPKSFTVKKVFWCKRGGGVAITVDKLRLLL